MKIWKGHNHVALALFALALLFIACWNFSWAVAQDSIRLVHLGDDRNLIARTSREGVVLHFMGMRSSPDDMVVLLPNRWYEADVRWLAGVGTVVVAAGPGETPVDVYGFNRDGRRLFRQKSRQEEGVRLYSIPGDSLVVVSNWGLPMPPEVLHAVTGEWMAGYLSWPYGGRDSRGRPVYRHGHLFVFDGGLVAMADRDQEEVIFSVQDISGDAPLWELRTTTGVIPTVQDTTFARFIPEEPTRRITLRSVFKSVLSERRIILAGAADGDNVLVSLDRDSGEILAVTRLAAHGVELLAETGGDRLLVVVKDRHNHGELLVFDQTTLELQGVIANPAGWYINSSILPRVLWTADGSICLVPAHFGGPEPGSTAPRSLVVTWGESVAVHWLDTTADMTDDGRILVAREYGWEGGIHEFRVEEWSP